MQRRPRTTDWRLWRRGSLWSARRRVNGVRESRPTGKSEKADAVAVIRKWNRESTDPAYEAATTTTLGDAVTDYLADYKWRVSQGKRAEASYSVARCKLGHVCRVLGASARLADLDFLRIDLYVKTRTAETASLHTVLKECNFIGAVLKRATKAGTFPYPLERIMPDKSIFEGAYVPRNTWLTEHDLEGLLSALPPERARHVAFIVATGARRSEAEKATRADCDAEAWRVKLHGTKTEGALRIVPIMLASQRALLVRALEGASKVHAGVESTPSGPLLTQWSNSSRDLKAACRAKTVNVPALSFNDLRRTAGKWLRQAGYSSAVIGAWLGHTSGVMADLVYARETVEERAESLAQTMRGQQASVTAEKIVADRLASTRPPAPAPAPLTSATPVDTGVTEARPEGARVIPISSAQRWSR